jgi:broad specificity phosphatase PhoE
MDIYFVRHGQTSGNEARRHQLETSRLTARGRAQASAAAHAIAAVRPTHLIVSSRVRAVETGQAIAHLTGLTPEVMELPAELCRPERLYGYHHHSLESITYVYRWYRGQVGVESCSEEGESYAHFLGRIKAMQAHLKTLPQDARVVVVSHSVFINFFIAHMNSLTPMPFWKAFLIFTKILRIKNGSITHVTYDPVAPAGKQWQLQAMSQRKVI